MSQVPIIISFYTDDEIYRPAAERLEASLTKFNLAHEITCYPTRGSWNDNCCYKAKFIYGMLREYAPLDLVWMDADAEVMQYPALLGEIKGDIATVVNKHGLLASVIYLKNSLEVETLINDWVRAVEANPNEFTADQIHLERLLKENRHQLTFEQLPPEYSFIPGVMGEMENPVILQHQASRQGRNLYPR